MALKFEYLTDEHNLTDDVVKGKLNDFHGIINDPKTQFYNTFKREELIASTIEAYNHFGAKKYFVHVGIGGSSLGPEMLISALGKTSTKFLFINNIDPEEIHEQLKSLLNVNLEDCLFYFVSKSGGTAETLAALAIISQFLELRSVVPADFNKYMIFATDPKKSELLEISKKLNIKTLEVPSDVGGRFSVLTPVGFFPALYAGLNLDLLYKGALDTHHALLASSTQNPLVKCAELINKSYHKGVNHTVMMPYSSKLKNFSFWFNQLWAESLGKKLNKKGKVVNVGLTPIASYGATDQHSIVQLFMEGPNDKLFFIIEVENFARNFNLTSSLTSPGLEKLAGFTLADLMEAEMQGTIKALVENNRQVIKLSITKNDEYHLASLVLFFESLTALMGTYLEIDPFDQPGVEAGKIYAFEYLNQL